MGISQWIWLLLSHYLLKLPLSTESLCKPSGKHLACLVSRDSLSSYPFSFFGWNLLMRISTTFSSLYNSALTKKKTKYQSFHLIADSTNQDSYRRAWKISAFCLIPQFWNTPIFNKLHNPYIFEINVFFHVYRVETKLIIHKRITEIRIRKIDHMFSHFKNNYCCSRNIFFTYEICT